MKLKAIVYPNREYLGKLFVGDSPVPIDLSARSSPEFAKADPSLGTYRLTKIAPVNESDAIQAYGSHIIFFESSSKQVLALHGGETDRIGGLLPTEGALRVRNSDLTYLVGLLHSDSNVILDIVEEKMGLGSRFSLGRVSRTSPKPVFRQNQQSESRDDSDGTDVFFWLWLYSELSSSNQTGTISAGDVYPDSTFTPGGGESGGGGATGQYQTDEPTRPLQTEAAAGLPLIVDPFQASVTEPSRAPERSEPSYSSDTTESAKSDDVGPSLRDDPQAGNVDTEHNVDSSSSSDMGSSADSVSQSSEAGSTSY